MRNLKSADDLSLRVEFYYSREINSLSDLQVGDPVIYTTRYHIYLSEVKKITPTTIVISNNDTVFYKENGRQKGGGSGYFEKAEIHLVSESYIKKIRHLDLKRVAAHKITTLRLEYLSIDQLNEVISLAEKLINSNTEKTENNKSRWVDRSRE